MNILKKINGTWVEVNDFVAQLPFKASNINYTTGILHIVAEAYNMTLSYGYGAGVNISNYIKVYEIYSNGVKVQVPSSEYTISPSTIQSGTGPVAHTITYSKNNSNYTYTIQMPRGGIEK